MDSVNGILCSITFLVSRFSGMSLRYRKWKPDRVWLFPPLPRDWWPENHLVYFPMDVTGQVDLSPIFDLLRQASGKSDKLNGTEKVAINSL